MKDLAGGTNGGDLGFSAEEQKVVLFELKKIAVGLMAKERPGHTLQPTILVNEAFMQLIAQKAFEKCGDQKHLYSLSACVMARVLVDHARRRNAQKRGALVHRTEYTAEEFENIAHPAPDDKLEAIWVIIEEIEVDNANAAQVAVLRFFYGHTMAEVADLLRISLSTAERAWDYFKASFKVKYGELDK